MMKISQKIKILLVFTTMAISALNQLSAFSSEKTILKCLGQEEYYIHKYKIKGPIYKLNQRLISEIINIGQIEVKKQYLEEICSVSGKNQTVSIKLLKLFLFKLDDMFVFGSNRLVENGLQKALINDVKKEVPKIFFSYLFELQSMADYPGCIENAIPEVSVLINRFITLEDHATLDYLLHEGGTIKAFFKKIKNIEKIISKCRELNNESDPEAL